MNPNPFRWTFRQQCLAGFLACASLIAFALYSQYQLGLLPCPLCIFQRVAFAALGVVFLLAGLHSPAGAAGRRAWAVPALVAAAVGAAIAGRHVWLQHLPADEVPACGPGLDWMMQTMPATGVLREVLTGSGECANVDWSFLGLSMPAWSLAWFVLLGAWAALAAFTRKRG
ncbi:MAG TPA: disulfide bond formation protein B [Xanthomonadaceae bacterium]|nr:disulfide bond formation protein B [Xanthomonadaceae bacterium]